MRGLRVLVEILSFLQYALMPNGLLPSLKEGI